jgi:hypothetical protein
MKKVTDASFIEITQIAAMAGREAVVQSKAKKQTQAISKDGMIYRCTPDGVREVIGSVGKRK